jgi:shikimate kinase
MNLYFFLEKKVIISNMLKKQNVFLIGLMGTGKTSIGKMLAKELNLVFYDSDQEIEKRTGAKIPWIFDLEGEQGFRQRESKVINELTQMHGIVLATGGGVVLNPNNRKALKANGVVIYLQATVDDLLQRTSRNQNRPLLLNTNPRTVLEKLLSQREPLYYEIADFVYDTSSQSVAEVADRILTDLRKKGFSQGSAETADF